LGSLLKKTIDKYAAEATKRAHTVINYCSVILVQKIIFILVFIYDLSFCGVVLSEARLV